MNVWNWERGRAVSFLEIFVLHFMYSVFAVQCYCRLCIRNRNTKEHEFGGWNPSIMTAFIKWTPKEHFFPSRSFSSQSLKNVIKDCEICISYNAAVYCSFFFSFCQFFSGKKTTTTLHDVLTWPFSMVKSSHLPLPPLANTITLSSTPA